MRTALAWLGTAAVHLLAASSAVASEGSEGAIVVAYGEILEPPYEFERIGSELWLNGTRFYPNPRPDRAPPSIEPGAAVAAAQEQQIMDELRAQALTAATEGRQDGLIDFEVAADVYRASPYVESVSTQGRTIRVKYTFSQAPLTMLFPLAEPTSMSKEEAIEQVQDQLRGRFLEVIESGGVYVFGGGYRTYRLGHNDDDLRLLVQDREARELTTKDESAVGLFVRDLTEREGDGEQD